MLLERDMRYLICHGPKPEFELDGDVNDKFYLPTRPVSSMRTHDVVILPRHAAIEEFTDFLMMLGVIMPKQILWTSGKNYLLDDDIDQELEHEIAKLVASGKWVIAPYSVTKPFKHWSTKLNLSIIGDHEDQWVRHYTTKKFLHPAVSDKMPKQPLVSQIPGVRIARGYSCTDLEDLRTAFYQLQADEIGECIVKPVDGSTGEGIFTVSSVRDFQDYTFPMGDVVIEEKLRIDLDKCGRQIAPSIQFMGRKISHQVTDQVIDGVAFAGNISPSATSRQFQDEVHFMTREIVAAIKPKGPGGLDFLSVDGRPVLVDPNIGRITAAHPAINFRNLYAPDACFETRKVSGTPKVTAREFWHECQNRNIAFKPGNGTISGVFPLCFIKDMWGMTIAIGNSREEVERLSKEAEECL